MPEIHRTENATPAPATRMAACFDGFRAGVAGDLHNPNGTAIDDFALRMSWRFGYLAGAKAAGYLVRGDEHANQRALFDLAVTCSAYEPLLKLMYATPNGGLRSKAVAGKLKAEGVKPGVPDICLPVARGGHHGLYIELKRDKTGRVSVEQRAWIDALREQGYRAEVALGWARAADILQQYLETQ